MEISMRVAAGLFVIGTIAATAAFHRAPGGAAVVTQVADLPPDVFAALGVPLADPGQPYRGSDAESADLPAARLLWARHERGLWEVEYEHGGRGHDFVLATLHPMATGWSVATARSATFQPPPKTP